MEIVYFTREKLDKETVDNVVNHVIFNKSRDVSLKDLIDRVFLNENEIEFDDEVH